MPKVGQSAYFIGKEPLFHGQTAAGLVHPAAVLLFNDERAFFALRRVAYDFRAGNRRL